MRARNMLAGMAAIMLTAAILPAQGASAKPAAKKETTAAAAKTDSTKGTKSKMAAKKDTTKAAAKKAAKKS